MKGKWKTYSQYIGDRWLYIAGRQLDMSKPLHGGNVEYANGYTEDEASVVELCERLNAEEGER